MAHENSIERRNEKKELDFELKKFDNSPTKYKKFLRTIVKRYKIDKPIAKEANKSEFCERVVSSFFTSAQVRHFSGQEKAEINKLIKERVKKAGGFLRQTEEKAKKDNDKDFTDSEFNSAYRLATAQSVTNPEGYVPFDDKIDIQESNGEIGYFYTED